MSGSGEDRQVPTLRAEVDAGTFRAWVRMIAPIASERRYGRARAILDTVRILTGYDGLRVRHVTEDHTAAADVLLGRRAFLAYDAAEGEIRVDLRKLEAFAKLTRRGDVIRLETAEGKLLLTVGHLTRTCGLSTEDVRSFKWPADIQSTARAVVGSDSLAGALRDAGGLAEHVRIRCADGAVVVSAGEHESTEAQLEAGDVTGEAAAAYPTGRLGEVAKAIGRGAELRLALGTDKPLRLEVDLAGKDAGVSATYLLAPYIEEPAPEPSCPEPLPAETEPVDPEPEAEPEPEPAEPEPGYMETYTPEVAYAMGRAAPSPLPEDQEPETVTELDGEVVGELTAPAEPGVPDCAICRGYGRIYSRRADYPCPGCGLTEWTDLQPAAPVPVGDLPAEGGWVESTRRHLRLLRGRDAA